MCYFYVSEYFYFKLQCYGVFNDTIFFFLIVFCHECGLTTLKINRHTTNNTTLLSEFCSNNFKMLFCSILNYEKVSKMVNFKTFFQ